MFSRTDKRTGKTYGAAPDPDVTDPEADARDYWNGLMWLLLTDPADVEAEARRLGLGVEDVLEGVPPREMQL